MITNKRILAVFMSVLMLSVPTPFMQIQKAESAPTLTTIPFTSGDVAPNIAYDSVKERAWATKYASGGSDFTGGLWRWDRLNGTLKLFIIPASMEDGSTIQAIGVALNTSGNVFVSTTRKLYKFVPQDGVFTEVSLLPFGGEMLFDGTYIWVAYRDGVRRINPSTLAIDDVVIASGKAFSFLADFNSGVVIVERIEKKVYEVSSTLTSTLRISSGLADPYGLDCTSSTCYLADYTGKVNEISTSTWSITTRNMYNGSRITDVVIYQDWAVVLDLVLKTVRVFNIPAWTSFANISLSFTPLYGNIDSLGRVYVGYYGSSGLIVIDNLFGVEPIPPQPSPRQGEGDQRLPVGEIKLAGDLTAKRGQSLNVSVSFTKAVDGYLNLYSGENYIGREFLGSVNMVNSTSKTISFEPDWVGSKPVFAKYSGDAKYKGNVSSYITLTSVIAKTGIETIKSSISIVERDIVVSIKSMDIHYIQNTTVLAQIKNDRGEVVYLAWVRDLQLKPDGSVSLGFGFATGVPRGLIEVFVWKSLEEAIPLAEVQTLRN